MGYVGYVHEKFGLSALTLMLVLGANGAYFAARYRPWVLVPVLLVAILLWALNLRDLLTPRIFILERGAIYWVLSWIAPAIVLGGVALGYLTRRRARIAVVADESR